MKIDLKEIRDAAEKVSDKTWIKKDSFEIECSGCGEVVCACDITSSDEYQTAYIQVCGMEIFTEPVAKHIATSNPQTVIDLLDMIDKMKNCMNCRYMTCDSDNCNNWELME